MKSEKFIQLYDKDKRPILDATGVLNYDKRGKRIDTIIKSLKRAKMIPKRAAYAAIHKTVLKSIIKLTGLHEIC